METIRRLKDSVVEFLSPKRRRTIGPTIATPANSKDFDRPYHSDPQYKKSRRKLDPAIEAPYNPSPLNPRKRPREEEEVATECSELKPDDSASQLNSFTREAGSEWGSEDEDEDYQQLDGEDDMEDDSSSGSDDSISGSDELEEDELAALSDDEEEAPEPKVSLEARVQEYLDRQAELELRKESIAKARKAGDWHTDALNLFERLTLRSFEPIIPQTWKIDFPTLPEILFAGIEDKSFIDYNHQPSGQGVNALQGLLSLGVRVRDNITVGLPTEKLMEQEINKYIKWSEKDGGYHKKRFLPVLSVVRARPKQSTDSIGRDITARMTFCAKKYREYFRASSNDEGDAQSDANAREPPLLYGIIVAQTMAIFVTLDASDPDAKVRHMQHFDFADKDMDVWNGFALAIMVICARNYILSMEDELEADDTPVIDEDA